MKYINTINKKYIHIIYFQGRRGLGKRFDIMFNYLIFFIIKVLYMYGQVVMVEQVMIAIVMDMLHQCGQYQ
jgi:hypothetical protein